LTKLIPLSEIKKHVYISWSTGSGKSEMLKILLYRMSGRKRKKTIVLIDPHWDLSEQVIRTKLIAESKKLVYFSPWLSNELFCIINPLEIQFSHPDQVVIHAQNLANAIEEIIWSDVSFSMSSILVPCLSILIYIKNSTLLDLIKLMYDDPYLIEEWKKSPIASHRKVFENFSNSHYKRTKMSIATRLQSFLNYPSFYHSTVWKSTIDIKTLINTWWILIFNLSERYFGVEASKAFWRFLLAMIKSYVKMRGSFRMPTYLFIDECQNFISPSINTILEQTRKYGLHLILANQSIERLWIIQKVVLSNTSVKLVWRNDSIITLKKMANIFWIKAEQLQKLKNFEFHLKTSFRKNKMIKSSPFLKKEERLNVNWEQYKKTLNRQLGKYYTPTIEINNELDQKSPLYEL